MTDNELEAWIVQCGRQMVAAQMLMDARGEDFFLMAGERDRWWIAERAALRERASRPHIVARMEGERGLA